ncbi:hypothetical protein O6H91_09G057600 [Diphasiastrum complanatum]|uniref:Uncharacterized protein n=1 Tax=Diphasiastrum complanatum TaxID=34168 RepID=A0ACC2CPC9_DIPCM|nr:hypothetical protein O6H91_09G057600 [Diphasiastrum complanatum]
MDTKSAVAVLTGTEGVSGVIRFTQSGDGPTAVTGTVTGLRPGPHFNPYNMEHGGPKDEIRHAGDLGNLRANSDGIAEVAIQDNQIPLSGSNSILGRAVVVHTDPDDLGKGGHELSKSTGNAGGRIACGVIGRQGED